MTDNELAPDENPPYDHGLYEEQILNEQVRQVFALAPLGIVATIINSLIVFFVMKDVMRHDLLFPWISAMIVITSVRGCVVFRFGRLPPEQATASRWAGHFLVGLAAIGAAWGAMGLFLFSGITPPYQVFIAFVLGGMAAGASSTFAPLRHGYIAFSLPALLPLALHFILMNEAFHSAMAAMTVLYGFLLWRISKHNYMVNRTSLLLRFENREIIESLKKAKNAVETLNTQLMAEIEAKQKAETELRAQQEHLETLVQERTADLAAAKDAAEAASIAKSEFVANMSHEMRTPLAGALGMVRLVLEMEIGGEERRLLEMARRSGESLLRIIADVLDFSRIEAGMMSFEEKPFVLAEVLTTALEVVSMHAREKEIDLSYKIGDEVPEQIAGDDGRLRQVLVNLLGNAVKFTDSGTVELAVSLEHPDSQESPYLLFAVRDTGAGIPPDQLERIFGKFTQLDSSVTKRHGGTGLGLALTRQIVSKMGGQIWAESSIGVGSSFYFTLPLDNGTCRQQPQG